MSLCATAGPEPDLLFVERRYQDQRGGWHCLSHNAGSAGFANLTLAGGHAFSEDLHTWYTTPTPAYTGAFVEQVGGATLPLAKRERPRLIFDQRTREPTHLVTAVVDAGADPRNCLGKALQPGSREEYQCWLLANNDPWPGYFDRSFTLVQPLRAAA